MSELSRQRGIPTAAIILIILGLVFLFNNLGWLPWGLWGTLWRLWPLILVIIGLNILLSRINPWLALGVTIVIVIIAVGISAFFAGIPGGRGGVSSFSEPLFGITSAQVEVNVSAGTLLIDSLPITSDRLATGETGQAGGRLSAQVSRQVNRVALKVEGSPGSWWSAGGRENWQLHLSPKIPMELVLKTGASTATIDLSQLRVNRLRVEAGASNVSITLPASAGSTEAIIKAGAANVNVTVAPGVAARVKAQIGLGSFNIDQARFPKSGDYFVSPDFERAANRVTIEIDSGLASVHIR